ncbi:hypothetical protein HQ865_06225 [Mucilaginibacter mali]|uniref:Uncharacterized protein n=1 Tax=Mucilaginibacter mali TaxID=2740462 RepID=A0A7D4PSU3_9SPHI|nr:hypothetical protein [Mucilaginibacter mali]QKJ29368.1 hypothetical protein HQ865_06225 [Mucilaginibacter mali]
MAIDAYGLQDIKKELQHLSSPRLAELVLCLARYKKENKELLAYLLFLAGDEEAFIQQAKYEIGMMFYSMPSQPFNAVKVLRKILRYITKLSRFSGSKGVEITLLISFCTNYLEYTYTKVNYKPLRTILIRQVEKVGKLISKLHEDLQFDYMTDYTQLLDAADAKLSWFNKMEFEI